MNQRSGSDYPAKAVDLDGQQDEFVRSTAIEIVLSPSASAKKRLEAALMLGYRLVRGDYVGTNTNRHDRWYWDLVDSDVVDRRGAGYATIGDALDTLSDILYAKVNASAD